MSKIIFILGAGASKEAGAPVMSEFLDVARDLSYKPEFSSAKTHFDSVFKAISSLRRVHSKSSLDLINIESIFETFHWNMIMETDLNVFNEELIKSLKIVITKTLENSIMFPINSNNQIIPPYGYNCFAKLLENLKEKNSVSVITFNYDIGLDFCLAHNNINFDYNLPSTASNNIRLLKLHGSINWGECNNCKIIYPIMPKDYLSKLPPNLAIYGNKKIPINIGSAISKNKHDCGNYLMEVPFIVPPISTKINYYSSILPIWKQAHKELSEAEYIYIIGYSLPKSDHFFRQLYSQGTCGETELRQFHIINNDKKVEQRFKALLGPGAKARFKIFDLTFSKSIEIIKGHLLKT